MKKKVMLHPNFVISKSDGDKHFIGASQLARLYGVLPTDDVRTYDPKNPMNDERRPENANVIHLYPNREGEYRDIHWADDYEVIRPS